MIIFVTKGLKIHDRLYFVRVVIVETNIVKVNLEKNIANVFKKSFFLCQYRNSKLINFISY